MYQAFGLVSPHCAVAAHNIGHAAAVPEHIKGIIRPFKLKEIDVFYNSIDAEFSYSNDMH